MKSKVIATLMGAAWGMAACTVGPDYRRPDVPMPSAYTERGVGAGTAPEADTADLSRWWTRFNDPLLTWLIDRALADNPNLQAAASRVRQARQQEIVAAAGEYPGVTASANALTFNSDRSSASNGAAGAGGLAGGAPIGLPIPAHANLYSAGFDATWEVDLFGGTRRSREAARDATQARAWAERDGEVSLTAEVAKDYLTLRALQTRIALGNAELARQKAVSSLVASRRRNGIVTNLDVNQQTTLVATASALIPQFEAQARGQMYALGVLVGRPPEMLVAVLGSEGALPAPPASLPTTLPSDLLQRRPDIREAERHLAASTARIGAETAKLYPRLNLVGLGSLAGTSLGDVLSSDNLSSAAFGTVTEPIFDAGRNLASVRAAREQAVQSELAYRYAVLVALRDVEDALARFTTEESRLAALHQSVVAARGSLVIARDQYSAGFVSFINVYQAEISELNAEDQLTQSQTQTLTDLVAVYKALGGGWSAQSGNLRSRGSDSAGEIDRVGKR